MSKYEGFVRFPVQMDFSPQVMGKSYRARIGGEQFEILFPRISDAGGEASGTLESPLNAPGFARFSEMEIDWGSVRRYSRSDMTPTAYEVSHVALKFDWVGEGLPYPHEAVRIGAAFDRWCAFFVDWLELWSGQPLIEDRRIRPATRGQFWLAASGESLTGWGPELFASFGGSAVTPEVLDRAFQAASKEAPPPRPWQMYLRALRAKDSHSRLIDAATAAETAIESRLYEVLENTHRLDVVAVEIIVNNANGIIAKMRLLKALLKIAAPSTRAVIEHIAEPRNRAVHSGHHPTDAQARAALTAAKEVLEVVSPLPGWHQPGATSEI